MSEANQRGSAKGSPRKATTNSRARGQGRESSAPEKRVYTHLTDEALEQLFSRVAAGESVSSVCGKGGIPGRAAFFSRVATDEVVRLQYEDALRARAQVYAESIVAIADEDVGTTLSGGMDTGAVSRNKLRVDARKWVASRLLPKVYGDRVTQEISGPDSGPIKFDVSGLSDAELETMVALFLKVQTASQKAEPSKGT